MPKAPCKDCKDRQVGCHAGCERYKGYRQMLDEKNDKRKEYIDQQAQIAEYTRDSKTKVRRRALQQGKKKIR